MNSDFKRYQTDMSLEELAALLDESDDINVDPDVLKFLEYMKVEPSEDEKVLSSVIYWFFVDWVKLGLCSSSELMTDHRFTRQLGKVFKSGRNGRGRYFRVKKAPFVLTFEEKKQMNKDRAKWLKVKKEKKRNIQD